MRVHIAVSWKIVIEEYAQNPQENSSSSHKYLCVTFRRTIDLLNRKGKTEAVWKKNCLKSLTEWRKKDNTHTHRWPFSYTLV